MFEPIRGGTRGGQAEFKWSDVSADKDREHYLGHSINAPTGRWQKNKDVHWYNRDLNDGEDERRAEIRRIKEAEEEAMSQALGFAPTKKSIDATENGDEEQGSPKAGPSGDISPPNNKESDILDRRMKKLEKMARKAEKKARKEAKRMGRKRDESLSENEREDYYRSGRLSRSPRRRDSRERDEYRSRRSASPPRVRRRSRSPLPRRDTRNYRDYDIGSSAQERERSRRR